MAQAAPRVRAATRKCINRVHSKKRKPYRNRRWRGWWWRRRRRRRRRRGRRLLFRRLLHRRLDKLHIVGYPDIIVYLAHPIPSQCTQRTWEQTRLGTPLPDPTPPSVVDFFNLVNQLTFDEGHFVVFRRLVWTVKVTARAVGEEGAGCIPRSRTKPRHRCLDHLEPERVRVRVLALVLAPALALALCAWMQTARLAGVAAGVAEVAAKGAH